MDDFLGDFYCKLDGKNRLTLPAALMRQLPGGGKAPIVINCGFENCLVIYPKTEWDKQMAKLAKLNQYDVENLRFIRHFKRGAVELTPDNNGRVLLTRILCEHAGMDAESAPDVVITCLVGKIEVWEKKAYEEMMNRPIDFAALSQKVMVDSGKGDEA